jgi:hypothetical protein
LIGIRLTGMAGCSMFTGLTRCVEVVSAVIMLCWCGLWNL